MRHLLRSLSGAVRRRLRPLIETPEARPARRLSASGPALDRRAALTLAFLALAVGFNTPQAHGGLRLRGAPAIPTIAPSATYSNSDGGFSAAQLIYLQNPPPRGLGRPCCRLSTPWFQTFNGRLRVHVHAESWAPLAYVTFYWAGGEARVYSKTRNNYAASDGTTSFTLNGRTHQRFTYGYHVDLDGEAARLLASDGTAELYVVATPSVASGLTEQFIGPCKYYPRAAGNLFDNTASVANATEVRNALQAAKTAGRVRSLITFTASGTYDLSTALASGYRTAQTFTKMVCAPGVQVTIAGCNLDFDGLWWGPGFKFDTSTNTVNASASSNGLMWFDATETYQSQGRYYIVPTTKYAINNNWFTGPTGGGQVFLTDCYIHDVYRGIGFARVARGCKVERVAEDGFRSVDCLQNCHLDDVDGSTYSTKVAAIRSTYSGAGACTVAVNGTTSTTSTRTITVTANGAPYTLTVNLNTTNWTFQDYADWANATVPGLAVAVLDNTVRLMQIASVSQTPAGPFGTTTITTDTDIYRLLDIHNDGHQFNGTFSNIAWQHFTMTNLNYAQVVFFDHSAPATFYDVVMSGFVTLSLTNGYSQLFGQHFNVTLKNGTSNNPWFLVTGSGGVPYAPDAQCHISGCYFESVSWSGTANANLIVENCYFRAVRQTLTQPSCIGPTSAATSTLFVDLANDNVTPLAGLLMGDGTYAGALLPGSGDWKLAA